MFVNYSSSTVLVPSLKCLFLSWKNVLRIHRLDIFLSYLQLKFWFSHRESGHLFVLAYVVKSKEHDESRFFFVNVAVFETVGQVAVKSFFCFGILFMRRGIYSSLIQVYHHPMVFIVRVVFTHCRWRTLFLAQIAVIGSHKRNVKMTVQSIVGSADCQKYREVFLFFVFYAHSHCYVLSPGLTLAVLSLCEVYKK